MTTKVSSTIDRPLQGVSQRERTLRVEGEVKDQVNMVSDRIKGLIKRPGTYWGGNLPDRDAGNEFIHHYKRGVEEYQIAIVQTADKDTGQRVIIHDMAGVRQTISSISSEAETYLTSANPKNELTAMSYADATFVANKVISPSMLSTLTDHSNRDAMIYVRRGAPGTKIRVYLKDEITTAQEILCSVVNHATDPLEWDSDFVADKMYTDINTRLSALQDDGKFPDYTLIGGSAYDHTGLIKISRDSAAGAFTLTVYDGNDNEDISSITGQVDSVDKLPANPPLGFYIKVTGSLNVKKDDYYLKSVVDPSDDSRDNLWAEVNKTGIKYLIDQTTMPIMITRDSITSGIASFSIDTIDWAERDVGDDETNKIPSFLEGDTSIKTMAIYENRLSFIHGAGTMSTSRTDDLFNLFKETATLSLATDPLVIESDGNQSTEIRSLSILDGSPILWSNTAQLELVSQQVGNRLVHKLKEVSRYNCIADVTPVGNGASLFFAYTKGNSSGVKEYSTMNNVAGNKHAEDLTEHLPTYIPGSIRAMAISGSSEDLAVLSDTVLNKIWMYRWEDVPEGRIQSAWSTWDFPEDAIVKDVYFSSGNMYIQIDRAGELSFEYLALNAVNEDTMDYYCALDRKVWTEATKLESFGLVNTWRMTKPLYEFDEDMLVYVRSSKTGGTAVGFEYDSGVGIEYSPGDNHDIFMNLANPDTTSVGDTIMVLAGLEYEGFVLPTLPVVKDYKDKVRSFEQLTVTRFYTYLLQAAHVEAEIINRYRYTVNVFFDGRYMNDDVNTIGKIGEVRETVWEFPVGLKARGTDLKFSSMSHFPFSIRDFEWKGRFSPRSKRV